MMPALAPGLTGDARVLAALERTRAVGLHFLGHYLSVCAVDDGQGGIRLRVVPPRVSEVEDGRADSMELAVLTDLASGSAIRTVFGQEVRLSTTHIALEHLRTPAPGALEARSRVTWSCTDTMEANAQCDVMDSSNRLVATSFAGFAALPPPPGRRLRPIQWHSPGGDVEARPDAGDRLTEIGLDDPEQLTLAALRAARELAGSEGVSVTTALVMPSKPPPPGNHVSYVLPDLSALTNRSGHMQGGALYAAAATAAAIALGSDWRVSGGAVQFVRPVETSSIEVVARIIRRGGRIAFSEVEVRSAGRVAMAGRFTHRRNEMRRRRGVTSPSAIA